MSSPLLLLLLLVMVVVLVQVATSFAAAGDNWTESSRTEQ